MQISDTSVATLHNAAHSAGRAAYDKVFVEAIAEFRATGLCEYDSLRLASRSARFAYDEAFDAEFDRLVGA